MNEQWKIVGALTAIFVVAYLLPRSDPRVQVAILEAFKMPQGAARNHTLACGVPPLFIAGAITILPSKEAVLRDLGPQAPKFAAYSVAWVAGTVLAACSCSVLPMVAGIDHVGAGLGPASALLHAGPAIHVLARALQARRRVQNSPAPRPSVPPPTAPPRRAGGSRRP